MGDWGGKNLEPWRGKKKQGTILTDHVIGVLGEMEASPYPGIHSDSCPCSDAI